MGVVSAITGDYAVGKGRLYLQVSGSDRMEEIGDMDAMAITQDNDRLERFSNQYGARTKTDSRIVQQNASVSFTCKQMTARVLSLAMMSDKAFLTQGAQTNVVVVYEDVAVGNIFDLGYLTCRSTRSPMSTRAGGLRSRHRLRAGHEVRLAEDHRHSGRCWLRPPHPVRRRRDPGGAKRLKAGLGAAPDLEAKLVYIGVDENSAPVQR